MADFEKVRQILLEAAPVAPDEITPETHLVRDLQIDSFGLMDMVLQFEETYGLSIPDRDLRRFSTVQDILTYLDKKTGG